MIRTMHAGKVEHLIVAPVALAVLLALSGCGSETGASTATPSMVTRVVSSNVTQTVAVTVTETATVTVAPPPPPGPAIEFGSGTFEVGVDVQPGKYKTAGPTDDLCYWARLSNDGSDILDNGLGEGPATITIRKGELIESRRCQMWTKVG